MNARYNPGLNGMVFNTYDAPTQDYARPAPAENAESCSGCGTTTDWHLLDCRALKHLRQTREMTRADLGLPEPNYSFWLGASA